MWTYTKLVGSAGLALGLFACAVGGGDGESDDDPMDEAGVVADAGTLDSGATGGLDSGPGGSFAPLDSSVPVDSSVPRDSSVSPADSSTPTPDAAAPLAGLGGLFGGLFGGGDSGVP